MWTVLDWLAANWIGVTLIAALVCAVGWYLWFDRSQARRLDGVEWDEDWQREPVTVEDADQLIADLRDEPLPLRVGTHEAAERMMSRGVWDQWWGGLDGLDRELLACRALREREARLWAELVAETRELCGLAA